MNPSVDKPVPVPHSDTNSIPGGFSLIEVLVTIIVFAIGILTVASLQLYSKKANNDAVQRSIATLLAYNLTERMRSNSRVQTGADPLARYVKQTVFGIGGGTLSTPIDCGTTDCNNIQMVDYDLWLLEHSLDGEEVTATGGGTTGMVGLVQPTACIRGPAGGAGIYNVIIAWRGAQALSNPIVDSAINACGTDSGKYGTNNEYRRVIMIQAYISPSF